jgi:hypothetical protein
VGIKRLLSGWMGTLLVGVLAGFIVSSGIGVVVRDSGFFGASKESPIARAYMLGLLQRDPGSISGIRPNQSISQRAETSRSTGSIQPLSLTYLGGAGAGGYSVHIYAVGLRTAEGDDQFFPMALTIAGGRVVRSE